MDTLLALLSPFSYLRIKHSLKRAVDVYCPIVFGILLATAGLWGGINLFGQSGAVTGINGLLQIVAGFFITSLAAIATFNGTIYRIDAFLEGEGALLDGEAQTRRQFLCRLFAYLAIASVLLYLVGVIGLACSDAMHANVIGYQRLLLRSAFFAVYGAAFGHIVGTMLMGLIFLSGRLAYVSPRDRFVAQSKSSEAASPDPHSAED